VERRQIAKANRKTAKGLHRWAKASMIGAHDDAAPRAIEAGGDRVDYALEIRALSKWHGTTRGVEDLSLALSPGETQQGTMELILSRATTKLHVYACAGLLTIVGTAALTLAMFLGTVVGTRLFPTERAIALYPFFVIAVNGGLLAGAAGAVALLAAATFRRRGTATSVTIAYLTVSYFVWVISNWWPRMHALGPLTLFHYVNIQQMLIEPAWPGGDMVVLGAVLGLATALGGVIWLRRDLPS
jgi:hypothetical protein